MICRSSLIYAVYTSFDMEIVNSSLPVSANIIPSENGFMCAFCCKEYKHKTALYIHFRKTCVVLTRQKEVNIAEEKRALAPFQCSKCPKLFIRKLNLIVHEKVHLKRSFSCENCFKLYITQESLDRHMEICFLPKYDEAEDDFRPSFIFLPQYR